MAGKKTKSGKYLKPKAESADSNQNESERLTFTVEEAARMLGISRAVAYAHARDRTIPAIRVGKRLLVPKAAFERFLGGE
jgi:excisionase family DNA binding protein